MVDPIGLFSYNFLLFYSKLIPKEILISKRFSHFFCYSGPIVYQWWNRDYLLATIAWGFLILLIAMHFIEQDVKRWQKIGLALLFGYSIASFILIEYPPFQIMTVFSLGLFYIGWLYQKNLFTKNNRKSLLKLLIWLIFGSVLALIPLLIYYIQDHPAISAVMGTTYPAKRIYESGSAGIHTLAHLLSGPFMAEIQKHTNAAKYYWGNQSEAAMFIQFSPILILPAIYAIYKSYKNNKRLRLDIVLLIVGLLIIYAYLFIPHLTLLYKILLFSSIPPNRMVLGIGLLDFLLLITLAIYYVKNPMRLKYANTIALITIACFLWSGLYTIQHYPDLIQTPIIVLGAAVWMGIALWLLLTKHPTASIIMLLIMTIISVYRVNPLYKGLSPLTGTPLSASIQNIVQKNPSKEWLTTEFILQDYPQANGAKSLTGDYSYPQTNIWKLFDSKNSDSYIYNRSAHVLAVVDNNNGISLLNENTFIIHINPCSNLVNALNIGYILTTYPENNRCLEQVSKIDFPKVTTYIYAFKPI